MRARLWFCLKALITAWAGMLTAGGAAQASPTCSDEIVQVSLAPGASKSHQMFGRLCHPSSGPSTVLQILVHGFTYDHRYWSSSDFGPTYDYVEAATDAGYSTFAVDRLGTAGQSSRPPSVLMTLQAHANSIHDVIGAARNGVLPGGPYETIIAVGHSAGSAALWIEASLFNDVDGIISSGFGHPLGSGHNLLLNATPAFFDSRLRPLVGLDLGYMTTAPGSRAGLFYNTATSDPSVIATDEATKGLGALTEFGTLPTSEISTIAITAPMLLVMGEYDNIFCIQASLGGLDDCTSDAMLYVSERLYFPLVSDFETYVQPGAGHNNNLHLNAQDWFDRAIGWALARFPPQ